MDPEPQARNNLTLYDISPETFSTNVNCVEDSQNLENFVQDEDPDLVLVWAPSGRRLVSGLLGLNVVLFGAALDAAQALNPEGLKNQEHQLFLILLMGVSLVWMLWYLLWARRQPGISLYKDHHAGGLTVTVVLMLFAAISLLLHIFRMGYYGMMSECNPLIHVLVPFIEGPFLGIQTYLLWAHSKDCIHKHKVLIRSGLMITLSADLLLWLNAVTEDTIHMSVDLEKEKQEALGNMSLVEFTVIPETDDISPISNMSCDCSAYVSCIIFRKGYEFLYPFNIEYYLMASCMLYVMWKNVSRRIVPGTTPHPDQKMTLQMVHKAGLIFGPVLGSLVLIAGVVVFVLYQFWLTQPEHRFMAFLMFYGYHLVVIPLMCLCSLAGMLIHKLERRAKEAGHNPTRRLDVILLVGTALGQLALSYFCLVSAMAMGSSNILGSMDLSYSVLTLLQLVLQNIFIIHGLHRHPSLSRAKKKGKQNGIKLEASDTSSEEISEVIGTCMPLPERSATSAPPNGQTENCTNAKYKRATQEICSFLILSNIMLWVIPAFGAHPQFENGIGKEFFGFTPWFILVNLGQPLGVFYRMHSVGALMELLISA